MEAVTNLIIVNVKGYEPLANTLALTLAPENTVPAPDPSIATFRTNLTEEFFYVETTVKLYSLFLFYKTSFRNGDRKFQLFQTSIT